MFLTPWMPWPVYLRGDGNAPESGQLAMVACPSGRIELAVVVAVWPRDGEE